MNKKNLNVLIIGGSSGLGRAMAEILDRRGFHVFVTGRDGSEFKHGNIVGINFDITQDARKLAIDLNSILEIIPSIDLLVYAAGYSQKGTIGKLDDIDIQTMVNIGLLAPALILQKILRKQEYLAGFIAITSTSQWIPRLGEPVYAAVKAGVAMLAHSVSLDPQIGKTLVVGPAGMNTKMQTGNNVSGRLLDPDWVAEQILALYDQEFKYKLARILRDPPRVEIVEQ
jgi:NAD(P)-dependent dehydrogenase (short-subunit alcohol dehydrogenase family)